MKLLSSIDENKDIVNKEYLTNNYQAKLVSGTNIKTVNSNSLLGSGNISVGTITGVSLDGTSVATSGVANVKAIPIAFGTSAVAGAAGTIVALKKYGNVNYNGSLIGTNILNLSINRFFHCYERGATITCNYFNNPNFFCDGAYSGHYPSVNPSTSFSTIPFVLEITKTSSFEMTDVSRLLIIGHRLTGSLKATKYKIEVAYAYSGGTHSWDTVIDYDGEAVEICQKFYGLYCSNQGSTSAPWHSIYGIRLTISGSTSTVFQIADVQLICGRGTEQPYESIHALSDAGGTIYGNLTVTGSITGTASNAAKTTGTLTIQKNGTQVGDTFNGSVNKTINIPIPVKTSELTNDSGYITNSDLPTNHVSYTQSTQTVAGLSKTVSKVNPTTIYVSNGLIMGGTAAAAGLVTRGICGVTTPTADGAANKDNLYINYDGNNDFNSSRQLILSAGEAGTHLGSNMYQYAAPRGEVVKNWVEAKGYTSNTGTITGVSVNGTSVATSGVANITSVPASILSGAIKNGVTATTQSAGDNSTKVATTAYVDTAITNLPEPMIFKGSLGTGGTITTLPAASSSNEGYTYKVITAGTYASQTAKIGDTFISDGSTWVLIPSGDEPSGTVTSVTIKATGPIAIDSSAAITTSGTRTISHSNSGVTAGTYRSVTVNATGHVTAGTNPTTLSGYGITDAKIDNGVITLGSNTITPLTSFTETDPMFTASAAYTIEQEDLTYWNSKQDQLVSGDNIKTINGVSILGTGNLIIGEGGSIATDVRINDTSVTDDGMANISVDGVYNAATNKIVTESSLTNLRNTITSDIPSIIDFVTYNTESFTNPITSTTKNVGVVTIAKSNNPIKVKVSDEVVAININGSAEIYMGLDSEGHARLYADNLEAFTAIQLGTFAWEKLSDGSIVFGGVE